MTIAAETDLQRAAELLELWHVCRKSHCRRARACRGEARACCEMLMDWSEALSLKDKRVGFEEAMQRLREGSGEADSFQPAKNVIPAQAGIQRAKRK
jgi:hypothetical protein